MIKNFKQYNESLGLDLEEYDHNYDIKGFCIKHEDGEFQKSYKDGFGKTVLESKTPHAWDAHLYPDEESALQISRYLMSERNMSNKVVKASEILVAAFHVEYANRYSDTDIKIGVLSVNQVPRIQKEIDDAQGRYGPETFLTLEDAKKATIDYCESMIEDMKNDIEGLKSISFESISRNNRYFKDYDKGD